MSLFAIDIDSDGGCIYIGSWSVTWANAIDPYFADVRMDGYCSFNFGATSIEFGCVDQEDPGLYITRYSEGDVEYSKPIFTIPLLRR